MLDFAANLHRLMVRQGLTVSDVVRRSTLDERTVKGILSGGNAKPRARTLHQLAEGLGVATDELFETPPALCQRLFDRQTNREVAHLVEASPSLFDGWTERDFDELYSRFGAGGALTADGAQAAVEAMNRNRDIHRKVALLLESGDRQLLMGIVELLYKRILVTD
jgi:transcriptional regulator with XRE-family HTH domain